MYEKAIHLQLELEKVVCYWKKMVYALQSGFSTTEDTAVVSVIWKQDQYIRLLQISVSSMTG